MLLKRASKTTTRRENARACRRPFVLFLRAQYTSHFWSLQLALGRFLFARQARLPPIIDTTCSCSRIVLACLETRRNDVDASFSQPERSPPPEQGKPLGECKLLFASWNKRERSAFAFLPRGQMLRAQLSQDWPTQNDARNRLSDEGKRLSHDRPNTLGYVKCTCQNTRTTLARRAIRINKEIDSRTNTRAPRIGVQKQ